MSKLDKIEEILNKHGKSIKMNNTDYIGSYAVFDILSNIWFELGDDRYEIADNLISIKT